MNFRQGCLADRRGGQEEGEEACVEGGQVAAVHKILESRCSANILSIEISSPPNPLPLLKIVGSGNFWESSLKKISNDTD